MGLFDAIKNIGSAVVDTALLPLDAAHDAVTLGGAVTDAESKLARRIRKIVDEADEAYEDTFRE